MSKPAAKSTKITDEGKAVPRETPESTAPSRRVWLIGGGVLVLLALLALFSGDDSKKKTIYTDGQEEQLEERVRLREVVWTHAAPLFPGEDDSVDRYDPAITDGGLTLVFVAGLPKQGANLFIVKRELPTDEWGAPQPLAAVNSNSDELGPAFSLDGRFLFFSSDREGGLGNHDIWVARREGDGWGRPINLGEGINTNYDEIDPAIRQSMDLPGNTGKRLHPAGLYFASNRSAAGQPDTKLPRWRGTARAEYPLQSENFDLFLARIKNEKLPEPTPPDSEVEAEVEPGKAVPADSAGALLAQVKTASPQKPWTFEKPQRLGYLNTPAPDAMPSVTQLGDYIYFSSPREGGEGGFDILRARWHPELHRVPSNVGSPLNTAANETDPVLYSHGHEMIFSSDRGAGETPTFQLFHSRTTEVIPFVQVTATTPRATGGFWHYLQDYKWWILLLLLALLALLALLKNFLDEESRRALSLLQKCLLGSLALHILLAFLLSLWVLSHAVYKTIIKEQALELALNEGNLAVQRMSQQIREAVPELPRAQANLPAEQPTQPASASVRQLNAAPAHPVETEQQASPSNFAVQPAQVQPTPVPQETLAEMTRPLKLPDQSPLETKPIKLETAEAKAQANPTLANVQPQQQVNPAATASAKANPQTAEKQPIDPAQLPPASLQLPAAPKMSALVPPVLESANPPKLPSVNAGPANVTQEQVAAQAQTNQQYSQPNAKANPEALQARNAEANPQSTARQQVQPAQAAKAATAQATSPVNAQNSTEIVQTAPAKDNLPRIQASHADTQQEQGTAKAQAGQALVKAAQGQAVKVAAKANHPQSQPDLDAALAKAVEAAEQVANAAVTNAAPAKLSAVAGSLNTATISPATAPDMTAAKTSLEQAKPEALAGPGLMTANKTNPLPAAKDNTLKSEVSAKAIRQVNNVVAKNVAVVERAGPVSAHAPTAQVQSAKVIAVVPDLQVADSQAGELESIEPTVSAGKQLGGAEAKQEVSQSKASVVKSNVLKHSTPLVAVIGLNKILEPTLQTALTMGAEMPRGSLSVATGSSLGPSVEGLAQGKFGSLESHPAAEKVAGKILQVAKGSVNIQAIAIPSSAAAGGPLETDQLVQSKALPKLGSMQMAALPTPELNAETLALPGAGNNVVLQEMEFKPGAVFEEPKRVANLMILRKNPKVRLDYIEQLGGSKETEKAVRRALDWFTRNQEEDGHWNRNGGHDVAATGMAMLAYMGWGAKHIDDSGPYQKQLAKAMKWMLREEKNKNGDLRGPHPGDMYDHGIAAIAMAEAYALTKDPDLKPVVERIVKFTVDAQNPKTGGWRYKPYWDWPKREKADMSVTGWQIMALKSAEMGGIKVSQVAFQRAARYLNKGSRGGGYSYQSGGGPNPAMTAEGMFCRQLLGGLFPPDHHRMRERAQFIQSKLPSHRNENYYYWYYGSLAMHQNQGEPWEKWNDKLRPILLRNQVRGGREDGSWDSTGKWGAEAKRCVITAMATLSLEVYYRYLPLSSPEWLKKGK